MMIPEGFGVRLEHSSGLDVALGVCISVFGLGFYADFKHAHFEVNFLIIYLQISFDPPA